MIKKSDECDEGIQFVNHNIIKSMITDRIGRHDVLLPIDQNNEKISEANYLWLICFHKKKLYSAKCVTKERSYEAYCPITQAWRVQCPNSFKNSLVITNHVRELLLWFCRGHGFKSCTGLDFFPSVVFTTA